MKKYMMWIALAALIFPALARGLWFYRGIPQQHKIRTPNYQQLAPAKMPLRPPADEQNVPQLGGVVLLDATHTNQYQLPELLALQEALEKRGGRIEIVSNAETLAYKLKYARAYMVVSPSVAFTSDEARTVEQFVERGGRLLVFTDATRGIIYSDFFTGSIINYSDAAAVNPLLAPFGITVNNDYLYNVNPNQNDGNFRNVFFDQFGKHELTFGLQRVALYGTHSLKSQGEVLLRGAPAIRSSIDDAHDPAAGGAALSADGNVLAFGDFTFLTAPYRHAADNATLINNIADFTLGGKRVPALEDFPFVFTQTAVQIYPAEEITLSPEVISALGGLQSTLAAVNTSITLTEKAPRDGDAILLGTFDSSAELEEYLAPFDLEIEDSSIALPKLGNIGRAGNGLILFSQNKNGVTLTLLADTPEDLIALISTLSGGSLSSCVLQGDIGICSVGFGDEYFDEGEPLLEPAEGEATPTPVISG